MSDVFLRELKEQGIINVTWIPGSENEADIFTKNLDGPLFETSTQAFTGKDQYSPLNNES